MTTTTTSTIDNPVRDAANILKTDGWATGAFLCTGYNENDDDPNGKPGSHCAIGAVRAAFRLNTYNRDQVVLAYEKRPVPENERYSDTPEDAFEFVITKSKPASKKLTARYRKALLLLADAVQPDWEGDYISAWRTSCSTRAEVRKVGIDIDELEEIVINYNDSFTLNANNRKKVLRRFEKAAKAWDAAAA